MKSKPYLRLFTLSAFAATLVACTDLDVDIKSQYTEFPTSDRAAEAISADVYAAYRAALGNNHWMAQTLSSDEAVSLSLGTDWYDGGRFRELHVHNWTPDNAILPTMWNAAMSGINLSNNVLAILGIMKVIKPHQCAP